MLANAVPLRRLRNPRWTFLRFQVSEVMARAQAVSILTKRPTGLPRSAASTIRYRRYIPYEVAG